MDTPDPEVDAMLDSIMIVDEPSESTSAAVASTAAKLLGAANPLMRGSEYHSAVLQAVKDSGLKADGKTLDLIDELGRVLEPFMADVRTVAGSALAQFQPVLEPGHD